jgi:cytochrome c5
MTFRSMIVLGALLGACGDDADDGSASEGASEGCPPELTYAAAGAPVLERYCAACHAPTSAEKLGDGNVIDSESRIREHGKGLYDLVLSGEMPKAGGPIPEQQKLDFLDWMECSGATASGHDHMH